MNIAVIGKFGVENVGVHVEDALQDMGHRVIRIDPQVNFLQYKFMGVYGRSMAKSFYSQFLDKIYLIRKQKSKQIYKLFKSQKVELTIVLHDFLTVEEVENIKLITKTPIAIWFPDAISNFSRSLFFVAPYDFLFFKDKYVVDKLKNEYNLNAYYLPQCCNPKVHKRIKLNQKDQSLYSCEISNAGNLYPSRAALYKQLTKYDFKMWGGGPALWLKAQELRPMIMGREVFNDDKCKAFTAAKIVLNNMHLAEICGLNKRAFEIPACYGFQIISFNDAVSDLFEIGKEIVVYHNLEDLIEKIDYYLDETNSKERDRIVANGHKRSITEHTYVIRLESLLKTVFDL